MLTFADWREALVSVAAHEARHIWQYQHGKTRSEVDAEQRAGVRLGEYRALLTALSVAAPGDGLSGQLAIEFDPSDLRSNRTA